MVPKFKKVEKFSKFAENNNVSFNNNLVQVSKTLTDMKETLKKLSKLTG